MCVYISSHCQAIQRLLPGCIMNCKWCKNNANYDVCLIHSFTIVTWLVFLVQHSLQLFQCKDGEATTDVQRIFFRISYLNTFRTVSTLYRKERHFFGQNSPRAKILCSVYEPYCQSPFHNLFFRHCLHVSSPPRQRSCTLMICDICRLYYLNWHIPNCPKPEKTGK